MKAFKYQLVNGVYTVSEADNCSEELIAVSTNKLKIYKVGNYNAAWIFSTREYPKEVIHKFLQNTLIFLGSGCYEVNDNPLALKATVVEGPEYSKVVIDTKPPQTAVPMYNILFQYRGHDIGIYDPDTHNLVLSNQNMPDWNARDLAVYASWLHTVAAHMAGNETIPITIRLD